MTINLLATLIDQGDHYFISMADFDLGKSGKSAHEVAEKIERSLDQLLYLQMRLLQQNSPPLNFNAGDGQRIDDAISQGRAYDIGTLDIKDKAGPPGYSGSYTIRMVQWK